MELIFCKPKHYIKLHSWTYITKISYAHGRYDYDPTECPLIPMNADSVYIHELGTAQPPITDADQKALAAEIDFGYHDAIGELIYAVCTYHPDISAATIKLSQYITHPTKIHSLDVHHIFYNLQATINDGIHYWHQHSVDSLPDAPQPSPFPDNYDLHATPPLECHHLYSFIDSDWAGDTAHHKSVMGVAICKWSH